MSNVTFEDFFDCFPQLLNRAAQVATSWFECAEIDQAPSVSLCVFINLLELGAEEQTGSGVWELKNRQVQGFGS